MQKQKGINWNLPISESLGRIKEIIEEKKSFKRCSFGIYRIPIKDEYEDMEEVLVVRGLVIGHQLSMAKAGNMTLSLTMRIGENEETFILTARDFESFIEFNNRDSYEIIFIKRKGYLRIEKSF
ncbi:hypothetical protein KAI56_03755 [Candidatus Parcubacteria bacterium]|nr:hypothetical protein [Candidatus Parcubacteria bacterium]